MNEQELKTVAPLRAFLNGTQEVQFEPQGEDSQRYAFIAAVVQRLRYGRLPRPDKGVVMHYLERTTGYARAPLKRLVRRARAGEALCPALYGARTGLCPPVHGGRCGTPGRDRRPARHVPGPATKCLMQRPNAVFGDTRYERLAGISVAHLYNLRGRVGYEIRRRHWTKTKGHRVPIAQRRAPAPDNRAGFIRIDSVHQGDRDGVKGLYHINAVDGVTPFEIVATGERLSEAYRLPVIETLLESFPFQILGFHADNGLAETKNGAIVRKHLGYSHIPQRLAAEVNARCQGFLNPYVNFHRPCFFAETITDDKGRTRKRYRQKDMMTPYEKLKSLPAAGAFLKPGLTFEQLDKIATAQSDNEAAEKLNEARKKLLQSINRRSRHAA